MGEGKSFEVKWYIYTRMRKVLTLIFFVFTGLFSGSMAQSGVSMAKLRLPPAEEAREDYPVSVSYQQLARQRASRAKERVNVFIISKEKKINLASTVFRFNAYIRGLFNRKIVVIKAGSLREMSGKTDAYMQDHPEHMIGHLWIDSHGRYKTGHSLFSVGLDTLSAYTIKTGDQFTELEKLTAYCDEQSVITIGACYAAADFQRPGNDILKPSYMAGDSLLLGMAEIFRISPVYGSLSWIMVKPFVFGSRWGISGYPLERKYLDEIYKPVWERLGQWKMVPAGKQIIEDVPTPYLSASGSLKTDGKSYLAISRNKRRMEKKLGRLKPGMYKLDRK